MKNRIMSEKNSIVAIFESHNQAGDAVRELQQSGVNMTKLSIVGKDYPPLAMPNIIASSSR